MVIKKIRINQEVFEYRCALQINGRAIIEVLLPAGDIKQFVVENIQQHVSGKVIGFTIQKKFYTYCVAPLSEGDGRIAVYNNQRQQLFFAIEQQAGKQLKPFMPAVISADSSVAPVATATDSLVIKSPLAGRVMRVLVAPGQLVARGMQLLTIESMKMENELCASSDGYIKTILIKEGDVVQQKQVVITLSIEGEGHAAQRSEHESATVSHRGSS
jgi:biotin carboxyl carrier protein